MYRHWRRMGWDVKSLVVMRCPVIVLALAGTPAALPFPIPRGSVVIPSPVPVVEEALSALRSYHVDVTVSSGLKQGPLQEVDFFHITAVHHGRTWELDSYQRYQYTPRRYIDVEIVVGATRACTRRLPDVRYTCTTDLPRVSTTTQLESTAFFRYNFMTAWSSLGSMVIGGRRCMGAAFDTGLRPDRTRTKEVLYIAPQSHLPCSLSYSLRMLPDRAPATIITMAWSRFNDPTLTIPHIPGQATSSREAIEPPQYRPGMIILLW